MPPSGEPTFESRPPSEFRELVEDLVKDSDVLPDWINPIDQNDTMSAIDAVEQHEVTAYLGENPGNDQTEAVGFLVEIYEELKKDEPDEAFIAELVEQLTALV